MTDAVIMLIGYLLGTIRYVAGRVVFITAVAIWVCGWVLASGFWSTLAAVAFPPWGWYLLAAAILGRFGI